AEFSRLQTLLFGNAGAVILTILLFAIGVFSLTGVSVSSLVGRTTRVASWLLDRTLAAADALVPVLDRVLEGGSNALAEIREGLVREGARARESLNALLVRRAQQERRARVLERRGPTLSFEQEL